MSTFSNQINYSIPTPSDWRNITVSDLISNTHLVVGQPGTYRSGNQDCGAVYLYNAASNFAQITTLNSPEAVNNEAFGFSLVSTAKDGGLSAYNYFIAVGEPARKIPVPSNSSYGRLRLYGTNDLSTISNSNIVQTLSSPRAGTVTGVRFGCSVGLSAMGNTAYMAVGEFNNGLTGGSFRDGAAHLYRVNNTGDGFNYVSTLGLPVVAYDDHKCNEILVEDDMIIVSANTSTNGAVVQAGDVYYFTYNPSTGVASAASSLSRNPVDIVTWDRFGSSIAMDKGVLVVGAPSDGRTGSLAPSYAGKAFIYKRSGAALNLVTKITPPASFNGFPINSSRLFFGGRVDCVRDSVNPSIVNILISAEGFDNGMIRRGAVFVYRFNINTNALTLNNIIALTPSELPANPGNRFGYWMQAAAKPNPDYTVIHASFNENDPVPAGLFSNSTYIYNGTDFLNTSTPVMYTSASFVAPGPFLRNETLGIDSSFDPSSTSAKTLRVQYSAVVSLSAGYVLSDPASTFYWYKDYNPSVPNTPVGVGDYLSLGSVSFSQAGTYTVSAVNLVGSGLAVNSSNQTYTNLLVVEGEPFSGGNRVLPDSGDLSLAGELAPTYRSINNFIKGYNGAGLTSPTSLDQREKDFMYPGAFAGSAASPVVGSKPSTGVDVGFNLSYISAMSGQLEMVRTPFSSSSVPGGIGGATVKYGWRSNKPDGTTFTPARMSEFFKTYKWYVVPGTSTKCFTFSQRSNAGWPGGPVGPGPNAGTIVVTPANNMITNNYYVAMASNNGGSVGSGKSLDTWYLGAPTVQFDNVGTGPEGSGGKQYTIYVMDENGFGYLRNVNELQTSTNLSYP